MIEALFKYNFMRNAVLSATLASIACGIIGTVIIEKRLVMMSGGIAHTAFGGIGMGYFLNIEPVIGGLIFSVLAALGITTIHRKTKTDAEILIGMFWSFGMALGILFIALTLGYPPDMTSYLFGDILTVSRVDLYLATALDVVIVFIIVAFFKAFKAYLFDEEFAGVIGIPVVAFEYMLFILVALTVVVLIRVVGVILVIALLTIPPSVAKRFTYNLKNVMLVSICLGMLLCFLGLWLSYEINIPSGASIILLSVSVYMIVSVFGKAGKARG